MQSHARYPLLALFVLGWALTACGEGPQNSTQVAARVDGKEITVHQVDQVLRQQRGLRPEEMETASKAALERLIDQELALQQARAQEIDREPAVVLAIEAARREIIARAYAERLGQRVAKPTAAEIEKYYQEQPALFSARRLYTLVDFTVNVPADRMGEVQSRIQAAKSPVELSDWLKAQNLPFGTEALTQPAESLPMALLQELGRMRDGQFLVQVQPHVVKAIFLQSSQPAPASLEQSRTLIAQYLTNSRRVAAAQTELAARRTAAKIEYLGKFASGASPSDARGGTDLDRPISASPSASQASGPGDPP